MHIDTLFFDGRCPLCSKEIKLLGRLKRDNLALVDIHHETSKALMGHREKTQLLQVLHLRKHDGAWLTGLDASVAAWRHTPIGFLFMPLRWPFIKPLADRVYSRWAVKRACRLGY